MTIRSHLVLLVCAALLPMLIFAALLTAWFWSAQSSASDQRFLERVRALSIAIDTEIEASIRVLDSLKQSPELEARVVEVELVLTVPRAASLKPCENWLARCAGRTRCGHRSDLRSTGWGGLAQGGRRPPREGDIIPPRLCAMVTP